jgi:DNA-binding phage protein
MPEVTAEMYQPVHRNPVMPERNRAPEPVVAQPEPQSPPHTPSREEVRRTTLAKNIRSLARGRRMPMIGLAQRAHVSRAQLYAVLSASSSPSLDWLCRIAEALEVEPSVLLQGIHTAPEYNQTQ